MEQKMGWKQKSAEKINFGATGSEVGRKIEEGEALTCRITAVEPITMSGKETHNYTAEEEGGNLITFLGTASLDRLLKDEVGSLVKITYVGDVKSSGGFNVKQFEGDVWEDDPEPALKAVAAKRK